MDPLASCELCPRRCRANRREGRLGYCRAGAEAEVFRYGPHSGEEPPVSGTRGSGTVFFSRCTLRCLYCQNHPWSQAGAGERKQAGQLADILRYLADAGCHNWNLVSPTPWLPMVREAAEALRKDGIRLPFVYNTSGFEREATLESFAELGDVFLTDLRYSREATAAAASDAGDYVERSRAALRRMWALRGPLRTDGDGVAVSGTICRLLVLPGHAPEAEESLEWLADAVGTEIHVSVMAQYRPAHRATVAPWDRRITEREYDRVVEAVERLGFSNGWVQEFDAEAPESLIGFRMPAGKG